MEKWNVGPPWLFSVFSLVLGCLRRFLAAWSPIRAYQAWLFSALFLRCVFWNAATYTSHIKLEVGSFMALYEGLYFTYMDWKFTFTEEPKSVQDQCNHFVLSREHIKKCCHWNSAKIVQESGHQMLEWVKNPVLGVENSMQCGNRGSKDFERIQNVPKL